MSATTRSRTGKHAERERLKREGERGKEGGRNSTLTVAWFRQKLFKLFNYAANRKLCGNFVATVGPDERMKDRQDGDVNVNVNVSSSSSSNSNSSSRKLLPGQVD